MAAEKYKTVVILCCCSGIITEKIDWSQVQQLLAQHHAVPQFLTDELACGAGNLENLVEYLKQERPDNIIVAACSPREHEKTFCQLAADAGINKYLVQMVNVREQVAWVTADAGDATRKAARLISAALYRGMEQKPLQERRLAVCTDLAVIGAGAAGMEAALTAARGGRNVTVIEREPFIGGLAVRFEELFPNLDCGPCLLEPFMGELLHGEHHGKITVLNLSEVVEVTGSYGNFTLKIRKKPRYINESCIGCMICASVCPARRVSKWNPQSEIAAVDASFTGALPNLPHIDSGSCLKLQGEECSLCVENCPVEGAINFCDAEELLNITVGGVVVATGAEEKTALPPLFSDVADIHTAYSFERLLSLNGQSGGEIVTEAGTPPTSIAIIHCAGSLDQSEAAYCSAVCCRAALKYAHIAHHKLPEARITRLVKEQSVPGREAWRQLEGDQSEVVRYTTLTDLKITGFGSERKLHLKGVEKSIDAELIVLMRPVTGSTGSGDLARCFDVSVDDYGFYKPMHPISAPCDTEMKGVNIAGSCRYPSDLKDAFASGRGAAGALLAGLVEGRELVVDPQVAIIDIDKCSGCRTCLNLCPYKAISWNEVQRVAECSDILCQGCGVCVASCPSGVITAAGFSRTMLRGELKGVLS